MAHILTNALVLTDADGDNWIRITTNDVAPDLAQYIPMEDTPRDLALVGPDHTVLIMTLAQIVETYGVIDSRNSL